MSTAKFRSLAAKHVALYSMLVSICSAQTTPPPAQRPLSFVNQAPITGGLDKAAAAMDRERVRMSDPANRAAYLANAEASITQSKARLLLRLADANIPYETLDALVRLLAERDLAMHLAPLLALAGRQANGTQPVISPIGQIAADTDKQVRVLLGEEAFEKYASHEQTEPYRGTVDNLLAKVKASGVTISEEKAQSILEGYAEAIFSAAQTSANDTTPAEFLALTKAQRNDLQIQQLRRLDQHMETIMALVFDPVELKLFMEIESAHAP